MDLTKVADLPTLHEGGHFVSAKISRIVQLIHDYSDGELEVQWVPPAIRENGPAFRIMHVRNTPTGHPYVAFVVQTEDLFDERVLKRVIANDQRTNSLQFSELEAYELAQRLERQRAKEDAMEEANDIAFHVLRTHKNTYKVNDQLVFKEHGPQMLNI